MKYLFDLGLSEDDIPQLMLRDDDRQVNWEKQRETYGFDERETWCLNDAFLQWLYCRLKMYNEVNCVDTSYHKFIYKNEEFTFQWCIDAMISKLEFVLNTDNHLSKEHDDSCDEILDIFKLCFHALWW